MNKYNLFQIAYNKLRISPILYKNKKRITDKQINWIITSIYDELYISNNLYIRDKFFLTVVAWFLDFIEHNNSCFNFIEIKLPIISRYLQILCNNNDIKNKYYKQIFSMNYYQFEKIFNKLEYNLSTSKYIQKNNIISSNKPINVNVLYIKNYNDYLNSKIRYYTGKDRDHQICFYNEENYNLYVNTNHLFIFYSQNYDTIFPCSNPYLTQAYDQYGLSIIYIIVNDNYVINKSFLRWGADLSPSRLYRNVYYAKAINNYELLNYIVGFDAHKKIISMLNT